LKDKLRLYGLDPVPKNLDEAVKIQKLLRSKILLKDLFEKINLIGGVDVSYKENRAKACVVVFSYPDLKFLEHKEEMCLVDFPYIPGFLSFREIPPLIKALEKLNNFPDLIMCDGQGIAHPRSMGIATHLGVLLDIPTIGVAKSKLVGSFKEPKDEKGSWEPMIYRNKVVGAVVRTKKGVKPLFVSPGHKISLKTAIEFVINTTTKYKTPEPIRMAHLYSKE